MSDIAYTNALEKRDQLHRDLERAAREIEIKSYELRAVQTFLDMYDKFANADVEPVTVLAFDPDTHTRILSPALQKFGTQRRRTLRSLS